MLNGIQSYLGILKKLRTIGVLAVHTERSDPVSLNHIMCFNPVLIPPPPKKSKITGLLDSPNITCIFSSRNVLGLYQTNC